MRPIENHPGRPVGRGAELEMGRRALEAAQAGAGGAVLLQGPAGIGKSMILEELAGLAEQMCFDVARSRANQLEMHKPFEVMLNALNLRQAITHPKVSTVARLLRKPAPQDFGPTDAQLPYRIIDGLVDLIEHLAAEAPLFLAVDDVHWCDVCTVAALERLSAKMGSLRLLLVLTFRPSSMPEEHQGLLDSLGQTGAAQVKLGGLDPRAQLDLARDILGAEPDPSVAQTISVTDGHPLYLVTLLHQMTCEGAISVAGGEARVVKPFRASSLEASLMFQFNGLSPQSQRILKVASILGCRFSAEDVATLFSENVASLLPFIAEAYEAGVLVESGSELSFQHEVLREVVINDIPSSVRKALHSDAARRLGEKGASAIRVAAHYLLGASPGDRGAVLWLRRAAREVCSTSPKTAVSLLESALLLNEDSVQERTEILSEMLNLLALIGDPERAEHLARELLSARPAGIRALQIQRDLARALWRQGRPEEAAHTLREVMGTEGLADSVRARLLAEVAYLEVKYQSAPDCSTELALEARALGKKAGDPVAVGMALHVLGRRAWWSNRFARGAALQEEAVKIAEGDAREVQYFTPYQHLALCLVELDRFEEAERALDTGMGMVHEIGEKAAYFHHFHAIRGYLYTLWGRWQEASAQFQSHIAISKGRTVYREAFEAALSIQAYLAIHSDELAVAGEIANSPGQSIETVVLALLKQAQGDLIGADAELAVWSSGSVSPVPIFRRLVWPEAVKLALELNRPETARGLVEQVEKVARLTKVASAQAASFRARGLLEGDLEMLLAALSGYEASQRWFEKASTAEEAAIAAASKGSQEDARQMILKAIESYERIGAARDLRRADAFARDLGIARGIRTKRQHATRGWESLTKTERKVLGMMAEGMTNKRIAHHLYISPRTVETHVMHILRKLGLKSRSEAAAVLARVWIDAGNSEHRGSLS